jgi:glycosyltransferase involved in cell wall biosynthesis
MRVAIVHDWLVTYAGSERVLAEMLVCFPQADVFSVLDALPVSERAFLGGRQVHTSFVQKLPGAKRRHRAYLPLMPLAVEQFDLSAYDLVISSSHAVAKGVLTGPDQLHVCMCYTPMRYAWDLQHQYLRESGMSGGLRGAVTRYLLHRLRLWDHRSAAGVDQFIAISHYIGRRIDKAYRRSSTVIYPPVNVDAFPCQAHKEDFYLAASRLVPYKQMPMIMAAFKRMPERRLIVIGDGPDAQRCRDLAGSNIRFLGHQSTEVLRDHMQRAKAFVFAAEEDFGITPLEAQACGTPVIAYARGAAKETLRGPSHAAPSAVFFQQQTPEAVVDAVLRFEGGEGDAIRPEACRSNAMRFAPPRFRQELMACIQQAWRAWMPGTPWSESNAVE